MKKLLLAFALIFSLNVNALEPEHLYWGYYALDGKTPCFVTVANGVASCTRPIQPGLLCNGGTVMLRYNPFIPAWSQYFGLNITTDVYIVGVTVNVWDTIATPGSQVSLQRDSDWAVITNVIVNGAATKREIYDGTFIRLKPTDQLLFESTCPVNNSRVVSIDISYTTSPP